MTIFFSLSIYLFNNIFNTFLLMVISVFTLWLFIFSCLFVFCWEGVGFFIFYYFLFLLTNGDQYETDPASGGLLHHWATATPTQEKLS